MESFSVAWGHPGRKTVTGLLPSPLIRSLICRACPQADPIWSREVEIRRESGRQQGEREGQR